MIFEVNLTKNKRLKGPRVKMKDAIIWAMNTPIYHSKPVVPLPQKTPFFSYEYNIKTASMESWMMKINSTRLRDKIECSRRGLMLIKSKNIRGKNKDIHQGWFDSEEMMNVSPNSFLKHIFIAFMFLFQSCLNQEFQINFPPLILLSFDQV